jgi:hypothetical protein
LKEIIWCQYTIAISYVAYNIYYQTAVTSLVEKGMASKQIAVLGGSHGGYLACHLLGQFPVIRNVNGYAMYAHHHHPSASPLFLFSSPY